MVGSMGGPLSFFPCTQGEGETKFTCTAEQDIANNPFAGLDMVSGDSYMPIAFSHPAFADVDGDGASVHSATNRTGSLCTAFR